MRKAITILYILIIFLAGWMAYICYCNLQFDANNSAGIIVSVLGILLTFSMAWNIYQIIDVGKIKSELEQVRNHTNISINRLNVDLFSSLVGLCKGQIQISEAEDTRKVEFLLIMNYLRLVSHKVQLKEFSDIKIQIDMMFKDVENRKPIKITSEENEYLHGLIGEILSECGKVCFSLHRSLWDIFNFTEDVNKME